MPDAVDLLSLEHQTVRHLCAEVNGLLLAGASVEERHAAETRLKAALLIHVALEDKWWFQGTTEAVRLSQALAAEEHRVIRWMVTQLQEPLPQPRARWLLLLDLVERHLRRERRDLFPAARKALDGLAADELSTALSLLRQGMSTRPLMDAIPRATPNWPGRELADPARKRTVPLMEPRFRL